MPKIQLVSQRGPNFVVLGGIGVAVLALIIFFTSMLEQVSTAHEAIATRFGEVVVGQVPLGEGLHIVNPLNDYTHYDLQLRTTEFEAIQVPAADKQKAQLDINIQWSMAQGASMKMRSTAGTLQRAFDQLFVPKARGILRDAGREIQKVAQFYDDVTVETYRQNALEDMQTALGPLGFEITDVVVRDVSLPKIIADTILATQKREQEVEQEKAELARIEQQAQQKVVQAQADLNAARLAAEAKVVTAKAEAEAIQLRQRQLTSEYIEYVRAQKWNGVFPSTMLGDGTSTLFQLGKN